MSLEIFIGKWVDGNQTKERHKLEDSKDDTHASLLTGKKDRG